MIRRLVFAAGLLVMAVYAQQDLPEDEQANLRQLLSEGASSPVDLIRALESHLAKYPESRRKPEFEHTILKAAIQAKDNRRIAQYGERVLARGDDDLSMVDPVCRVLVQEHSPEEVKAGIACAERYQARVHELMKELPGETSERGRRKDELDRLLSRALLDQAIGQRALGNSKADADLAARSFDAYPSADPAIELGRALASLANMEHAARAYADAFTIPDERITDADRAEVRRRLGAVYQKWKGSEAGLGDLVLAAYDRNTALLAARRLALQAFDPNLGLTNPMEFTLDSVNAEKLPLKSLAGKVVVMDFWATWCGPCRVQHPLNEQVKERFATNKDVVFLSIDADEDQAVVKPFLEQQGWKQAVYYEGGLARVLRVSNIPTTIVFGRNGAILSRMNGFNPESFVDVLSGRIQEALAANSARESQ